MTKEKAIKKAFEMAVKAVREQSFSLFEEVDRFCYEHDIFLADCREGDILQIAIEDDIIYYQNNE